MTYTISRLGDSALLIQFPNELSDAVFEQVMAMTSALKLAQITGIVDIVPAYCSIAVYYNILHLKTFEKNDATFDWLSKKIKALSTPLLAVQAPISRIIDVPVCYDAALGNDLDRLAETHQTTPEFIIHTHAQTNYRVYMMGFLPGFAYMGENPAGIRFPRKGAPVSVKSGAVAVAGLQAGIYPTASQGGWQVLGHTPIKLFDPTVAPYCFFQPNDRVNFIPVTLDQFRTLISQPS